GCRFAGEISNLLLDLVFEDVKIFSFEIGNGPVVGINHRDVHHHEINVHLEGFLRRVEDTAANGKYRYKNEYRTSRSHNLAELYHSDGGYSSMDRLIATPD